MHVLVRACAFTAAAAAAPSVLALSLGPLLSLSGSAATPVTRVPRTALPPTWPDGRLLPTHPRAHTAHTLLLRLRPSVPIAPERRHNGRRQTAVRQAPHVHLLLLLLHGSCYSRRRGSSSSSMLLLLLLVRLSGSGGCSGGCLLLLQRLSQLGRLRLLLLLQLLLLLLLLQLRLRLLLGKLHELRCERLVAAGQQQRSRLEAAQPAQPAAAAAECDVRRAEGYGAASARRRGQRSSRSTG